MITHLRGKMGAWVIGGIIGFISFVFVFEGVFSPKNTSGLHEGAVAGNVNGESISLTDFNRALERRTEYMKSMIGGKITDEQMKMFRVRESTFQELVQQKLLAQAARKNGLEPSEEQIRQEIMKLPYFLKDGKFDVNLYKNILAANNMSASSFEKTMSEQLCVEEFTRELASQVRVADAEVREEFMLSKEQRNVKYVSLPSQSEKKGDLAPKDLAKKLVDLLKADKSSDAAVNAIVKPYGAEVRSTNLVSKNSGFLPGIGEDPAVLGEVFSKNPPLASKPKVYETGGRIVVALVTEVKNADLSQFDKERAQVFAQVKSKKERALLDLAMKKLSEKAKVVPNAAIVGGSDEKDSG